jgi:GIY-YIG catalytic domain
VSASFPVTSPERLFSRADVLQRPSPVPAANGIYAWYLRDVPAVVPTDGCLTFDGKTLLYLGIAPENANSRSSLSSRIRQHYRGNASSSTLRRTLGVLLEDQSGFPLRRVGSGRRITLTHAGERFLDEWMARNAFVAWAVHPEPWIIEHGLLRQLSCPLNIKDNGHHAFASVLKGMRAAVLERARKMPIANEHNQAR